MASPLRVPVGYITVRCLSYAEGTPTWRLSVIDVLVPFRREGVMVAARIFANDPHGIIGRPLVSEKRTSLTHKCVRHLLGSRFFLAHMPTRRLSCFIITLHPNPCNIQHERLHPPLTCQTHSDGPAIDFADAVGDGNGW